MTVDHDEDFFLTVTVDTAHSDINVVVTVDNIHTGDIGGKYFLQVFDRYAVMVSEAIEKLKEYYASDEMNIDLEETGMTYDVGDIVGTTEQVTGIEATQEVVKKIITIKNDDVVISYEVG